MIYFIFAMVIYLIAIFTYWTHIKTFTKGDIIQISMLVSIFLLTNAKLKYIK